MGPKTGPMPTNESLMRSAHLLVASLSARRLLPLSRPAVHGETIRQHCLILAPSKPSGDGKVKLPPSKRSATQRKIASLTHHTQVGAMARIARAGRFPIGTQDPQLRALILRTRCSGKTRGSRTPTRSASEEELTSQLISSLALRAGVNNVAGTKGTTSSTARSPSEATTPHRHRPRFAPRRPLRYAGRRSCSRADRQTETEGEGR